MSRTRKLGGGVRQLPSGMFQVRIDGLDGVRRSAGTFANEADAWTALKRLSSEVEQGTAKPIRQAPLLRDYAEKEIRIRDVRPRTRTNYEILWRRLLEPQFGHVRLDRVSPSEVRIWWSIHSEHPTNRRNGYFLLKSIFVSAVEDELIESSPCRIRDAGRDAAVPRPTWLRSDYIDVVRFLERRWALPIQVLFASHCRVGELIALDRSDCDLDTGVLSITKQRGGRPTKTGQHRRIRLLAEGRAALEAHLRPSDGMDEQLFIGVNGRRLGEAGLRAAWNDAVLKSGRSNFHLDDIRHLGLTLAADSGLTVREIMQRGGHSSINAAMRYQHLNAEKAAEAGDRIDRRLEAM